MQEPPITWLLTEGCARLCEQVHNDEEVRVLFRAVAGEVPGSPIFAMKLAPTSRHLEVRAGVIIVTV